MASRAEIRSVNGRVAGFNVSNRRRSLSCDDARW